MCGRDYDATKQLVNGQCHYRRSGVLGAEKNAQGAVPVALTLQQLESNLSQTLRSSMYSTSLELVPRDNALPKCEVDFVWLINLGYPEKTIIILGECEDRGRNNANPGDGKTIDPKDIANLKVVADAFAEKRFETFILLAKLCPFTEVEVKAASTLNDRYRQRAILLTARELEPWHIYDRTKAAFNIQSYGGSAEALAQATAMIYFKEAAAQQPPNSTPRD